MKTEPVQSNNPLRLLLFLLLVNLLILVFGHEPAYVQPDQDTGRVRHLGDSLDQYPSRRDRFWGLLQSKRVADIFSFCHARFSRRL